MRKEIKCLIVEDIEENATYLMNLVTSNFNSIAIEGITRDVSTSIDAIKKVGPDLIFMDVELDGGDAFDIISQIDTSNVEIIFTTAHSSYMERAMEHYAFYFLLKPINEEKLISVLNRFILKNERLYSSDKYNRFKQFISDHNPKLLIDLGKEYISVEINSVVKCIADQNYTVFHLEANKKYLASHLLKHYDQLLSFKGFFRANRSTLINVNHVKSIQKDKTIVMTDGSCVAVSIRNRSNLTNLISGLS